MTITITETDYIERDKATKPWTLNETTVHEIERFNGLHSRIDVVYVPWRVREPVDFVEVLFTIDRQVIERRDRTMADVVEDVVEVIEDDSRLEEYVIWDAIEPEAECAVIDDDRARMRLVWKVRGDE